MDLTEVAVFSNPARTHQGQNRTLARTGHRINQVQVLCVRPEDEVGVTEMEKGHFASSGMKFSDQIYISDNVGKSSCRHLAASE